MVYVNNCLNGYRVKLFEIWIKDFMDNYWIEVGVYFFFCLVV